MINRREDAIERALDDWWDGVASGQEVDPDSMLSSVTTMTVERLHADDDAPAPNPNFVQLLRGDLARDAEISASSWLPTVAEPELEPLQIETLTDEPKPKPFRIRRGRALLELAAVAVLALGLVSTMFGGSPFAALNLWPRPPVDRVTTDPNVGMYRGDAARTGVMAGPGPVGQPILHWTQSVELLGFPAEPVVAGNRIYFVAGQRDVVSIASATGEINWRVNVGFVDRSDPAIGRDMLYVATTPESDGWDPGHLIALDIATGAERWRYETGGVSNSAPAIANGTVFVMPSDESLRAVDAVTGSERWRFDLTVDREAGTILSEGSDYFPSSPAVADGLVYAADNAGRLFAIDASTGEEKWRYQSQKGFLATPVVADGTIYLASLVSAWDLPTAITSLDAKTGVEQRTWTFERNIRFPPVVAGGFVYVSGTGVQNQGVTAIDWSKGEEAWTFQASGGLPEAPIYADGVLYVTGHDGGVYAIDGESGSLIWRAYLGEIALSVPAVTAGSVIVLGYNQGNGALHSIGGDGDTTALAASPERRFDLSGLPPCEPYRSEPNMMAPGTPAASLEIQRNYETWGAPELLSSEIPDGEPASEEVVNGILDTLGRIVNCSRPIDDLQRLSFYSDDFFRREWVERFIQPGPYNDSSGPILNIVELSGDPITTLDDARVLPDGRVGVLEMFDDSYGRFIIFVKQGEHWYIDEMFNVVPQLGGMG